jgi:hypothetical protein
MTERRTIGRRTGRTTRQLLAAPYGATYVCLDPEALRRLALALARGDLRFARAALLRANPDALKGLRHVAVDHAVTEGSTWAQWRAWCAAGYVVGGLPWAEDAKPPRTWWQRWRAWFAAR